MSLTKKPIQNMYELTIMYPKYEITYTDDNEDDSDYFPRILLSLKTSKFYTKLLGNYPHINDRYRDLFNGSGNMIDVDLHTLNLMFDLSNLDLVQMKSNDIAYPDFICSDEHTIVRRCPLRFSIGEVQASSKIIV